MRPQPLIITTNKGDSKHMMLKIRQIRKAKGMNQGDLAKEINVTQAYITMIEQGKRTPSSEVLMAIANTLGVKPNDLYVVNITDEFDVFEDTVLTAIQTARQNKESGDITPLDALEDVKTSICNYVCPIPEEDAAV